MLSSSIASMISTIVRVYQAMRCRRIAAGIAPHLRAGDRVLDFGCGSLRIAKEIRSLVDVSIIGTDVVDHTEHLIRNDIPFTLFDGKHLPFPDKSFDVTSIAFVLCHTTDAEHLLRECLRVTKHRIILLENVYRNAFDLWLTKAMNYGTRLEHPGIALPFTFRREEEWKSMLLRLGCKNIHMKKIRAVPFRPVRNRVFIAEI